MCIDSEMKVADCERTLENIIITIIMMYHSLKIITDNSWNCYAILYVRTYIAISDLLILIKTDDCMVLTQVAYFKKQLTSLKWVNSY